MYILVALISFNIEENERTKKWEAGEKRSENQTTALWSFILPFVMI